MQVKDKVAIVTGGSNGIGAALCRKLSEKGAKAVVVADIDFEGASPWPGKSAGWPSSATWQRKRIFLRWSGKPKPGSGPWICFFSNAGILIQGLLEVSNCRLAAHVGDQCHVPYLWGPGRDSRNDGTGFRRICHHGIGSRPP